MFAHGDKIKGYEIIAPLRSGGMAMLYLARRRGVGGFSRLVALKLVHPHLADDAGVKRLFLQEARIAASVAHPNVVNVEEVGESDGKYFIAMEYVLGVSLAELLTSLQKRRLRMSAKLCIWVAAHIAEALHAAHEATGESGLPLHIVHRDVSPQNVLIGHNGHVKLIDFGIAKSLRLSRNATGGAVLGKLGYMSPEQLRGEPVDRRTDVYALGVTLWEMLTSRSLLRAVRIGDEQDWATRVDPPAASRYSPISTPALDRAVAKSIAFEAADRYASALEFRAVLLQAEPAAAEVDGPRFAALMHSVLGDELERQRASWPREVSAELEVESTQTVAQAENIEELTTLWSADARDADDADDPTVIKEAPLSLRLERGVEAGADPARTEVPLARCAVQTPVRGVLKSDAEGSAARWPRLRAVAFAAFCASIATLSAAPAAAPSSRVRASEKVGAAVASPQVERQPPLAERAKPPASPDQTPDAPVEDEPAASDRGQAAGAPETASGSARPATPAPETGSARPATPAPETDSARPATPAPETDGARPATSGSHEVARGEARKRSASPLREPNQLLREHTERRRSTRVR